MQIATVAPALFTADASGQGPLASLLLRIKANGQQIFEPLSKHDGTKFVTQPIDFGEESDQLFLILYLTGIRQAASSSVRVSIGGVEYAPLGLAPVDGLAGLDQINVALPRSFSGRGRITLLVKATGYDASNAAEFEIGSGTTAPTGNAPIQITGPLSSSWLAGEEVEINGTGFAASPRENLVQIVASDGVTTKAEVIAMTGTSMRVRVPYGAGTGQIKVSRGQNEASQTVQVRTSISGFVEEAVMQNDGSVLRIPIPGARVRLANNAASERVVGADGSYVMPDVPVGLNQIEIIPPSNNINYPSSRFKKAAVANRDNQVERGTEIAQIGGTQFPLQSGDGTADAAPAAVVTYLPPGRTPANLPAGYFSTSIAQITPFGQSISPGAKLSFPNSDAIPAGAKARLFKFDQTPGSPTLGEFVDIGEAIVTADGKQVETAPNAITVGSYYFVSIQHPRATINGRVVESDGRPVPRAIVQTRGQSTFTDGFGGFVLRDVPVLTPTGDRVKVEVSYQRPNGRVARKDSNEVVLIAGTLVTVKPEIVLDAVTTNFPPVILAPATLTLNAGETRDFDFIIADPDSAQPPQVSISGSAAAFTALSSQGQNAYRLRLSPGANAAGSYTLNLTATDGVAAPITQTIAVAVNQTANTPTAQGQSVTTPEDSARAITLAGSNPGGGALSYTIVRGPARGNLSGAAPNLLYTPARDFNGVDSFTFKVSSGSAESVAATVFIAVSPVNDAPVLTVPGTQSVNAGETLNLLVTATDVDGDQALRFTVTGLPPGATFAEAGGASRQLSWTPTFTQSGTYTVSITVTDSGSPALSETKTVRIIVDARWAKTSGPAGAEVADILVKDGSLYLGTSGGIYRSTDNGKSWIPANVGLTNADVKTLAAVGTNLFAGTFGGGVFRSTDGGVIWRAVNQGITNGAVGALATKGTDLFVGTDGGVFVTSNQGDNWVSASRGLTILDVNALAVKGNNVFAGTYRGGVFVSTDNGGNWVPANAGLTDLRINTLVVVGNSLYAGTGGGGVFVSVDEGQHWIQRGLTGLAVYDFVVKGRFLFAATSFGAYITEDGGNNWRQARTGLTNLVVFTLGINGDSLFAGTFGSGVFLSANDGQNWQPVNAGLANAFVQSVVANREALFAGTLGEGVSISTDNGQSWRAINSGLTNTNVLALALTSTTLFAGTAGSGVFRSVNSGQSWTQINTGLSNGAVYALLVRGTNLYAGTAGGVSVLAENSQSWANTSLTNTFVNTLATDGANLYAGTRGNGLFVSNNGGQSWTPINNGLTDQDVRAVVKAGNTLLAGTYGGGLFRSTDEGRNWVKVFTAGMHVYIYSLTVSGSYVFAGTFLTGVWISANEGQSWTSVNTGLTNGTVNAIFVNGTKLFAGTPGGVFLLTDNVQSWVEGNAGLASRSVNSFSASGSTLFAGTLGNGIFRSSDQGQNWSQVSNGLPQNANIQSIVINGSTLWAAAFGDGVFRSTDQGTNWAAVNNGLNNRFVNELFISGGVLYAGTDGGVFRSTDGGTSWSDINSGLTTRRAISFTANGEAIYVGTSGGGVFRLNGDGVSWTAVNNGLTNLAVTALGANNSVLYAGTDGGGICVSRDGGEHWVAVNNDLPSTLNVYAFAVSGQRIYAASIYGVFVTENEGQSWKQVNAGLLDVYVTSLAVSDGKLLAGTLNGGVFVSQIPDTNGSGGNVPRGTVVINVYNVNDVATVYVNGTLVTRAGYRETREIDITSLLRAGTNDVRFVTENLDFGYTYGFRIYQNNQLIFREECGFVGVSGCDNNSQRRGVVYDKTVSVVVGTTP